MFNSAPLPPESKKFSTSAYYKESFAIAFLPHLIKIISTQEDIYIPARGCSTMTLYHQATNAWKYIIDHCREMPLLQGSPLEEIISSKKLFTTKILEEGILLTKKTKVSVKECPTKPTATHGPKKKKIEWEPELHEWLEKESPKEGFSLQGLALSDTDQHRVVRILEGLGYKDYAVTANSLTISDL